MLREHHQHINFVCVEHFYFRMLTGWCWPLWYIHKRLRRHVDS